MSPTLGDMSIGARIKKLRTAKGLTMQQVADYFSISRAAVSMWETEDSRPDQDRLPALATLLDTSVEYLLQGGLRGRRGSSNALVPLISWVAAGDWNRAEDGFEAGQADDWILCPKTHSPATYALRVRGDSMTATHGKTYPDGCTIFVDPELRSPNPADPIIAKLEGVDEVTFKAFALDSGVAFLRPLNPQYPPIMAPFRVLGTIIGKWEEP